MTTSGTYAFNPSLGELTLYAFNLAGVRNTALLQEHMQSAKMATNMMLANWANQGVNLWKVDLVTVDLLQTPSVLTATVSGGIATLTYATPNTPIYPVDFSITVSGVSVAGYNGSFTVTGSGPGYVNYATAAATSGTGGTITSSTPSPTYGVNPNTVVILDAYMGIVQTGSPEIDRIITPISRTEYASYPNKLQTGFSTTFWFDRLIAPTVTLWPAPDGSSAQVLKYYRVTQIEDANFQGGQTVDVPYLWMEAFADGLAYRLAKVWNPQIAPALKAVADETYDIASRQNVETAQQYISPQVMGYYRP
jgi:hypothetical protein